MMVKFINHLQFVFFVPYLKNPFLQVPSFGTSEGCYPLIAFSAECGSHFPVCLCTHYLVSWTVLMIML